MPASLSSHLPYFWLAATIVGAWFTWNAYRPRYAPAPLATLSFFAGWITAELALHHVAWQVAMTAVFWWLGAIRGWPGAVGVAITVASWAALARCFVGARAAEEVMERALVAALGPDYGERIRPEIRARFAPGVHWNELVLPFPIRHSEVERVRDVPFVEHGGRPLRLDVYRRRDRPTNAPMLLQIHGGGWVLGSKNEQGLPLMTLLAARGWVCVSADYRLAPRATFPDPLVDCKHALRWMREHAAEWGGDPDFVVVTGGSAGGHLAALVALTENEAAYQPGFETADTSVQGCVAFYGVYDFTDRGGHWPHRGLRRLVERHVLKQRFDEAPDAFHAASPLSRVHPKAPPILVIHGDRDTLVPVGEARAFHAAYRAATSAIAAYAEIPGAQHAFEIFPSMRTTFVLHGVERFLAYLYSEYLNARGIRTDAAATPAA